MKNKHALIGGLIGAPIGLYIHWIVFGQLSNVQQLAISVVFGALIFGYVIGRRL